jgi:hypothetical protein
MKKSQTKRFLFVLLLITYHLSLITSLSGCIRLAGGAGVWKKSADEETPTSHQVGFDTQQMIPQKNQGNITV